MRYNIGDIVRATNTFHSAHIFSGHEYSVLRVLSASDKDTVFLSVPSHRDREMEVWIGYITLVSRPIKCMFK